MNIIKKVTITGFWGTRNFSLPMHSDVNFLIGVNGTGKTTAINLIAAALNADFRTLDRITFDKIDIQLDEIGGSRKPSIRVLKEPINGLPFSKISYIIKDKASGNETIYSLDSIEEQLAFREIPARYLRDQLLRPIPGVTQHLKKLINVSWLSIHRSEGARSNLDERTYESTIDRKLDDLSNEFVKFFSLLTKQATTEIERFQKMVFLSLIPKQSTDEILSSVSQLNLQNEQSGLIEIFKNFHIPMKDYTGQVKHHFTTVDSALEQFRNKEPSFTTDHFLSLVNAWRIHSVVQEWSKLIDKQEEIYEPRDTFVNVVNAMLRHKKLEINDKNELIVMTESGKPLPLRQLSSGEKQLIIVLGEALIQQREPWIYIADEPELSLHVKWQEQLIANLRSINPNVQILFATHSPDIVSVYGEMVFDMEKVLE